MSFRKIALCCAGATVGYYAVKTLMNADVRGTLSALCEALASEPDISPDLARDAFASVNVDPLPPVTGHTHPDAAMCRTTATNFAKKMASHCGVKLYVVGMSKSDQRKGLRGSRQWFWSKDTHVCNRKDVPLADDVEYICDVDYYMDMPSFLNARAKPTLLYTVVPEAASTDGVDDTTTFFDVDGSLRTLVAGGGAYSHHLWDYAGDSLLVSRKIWGIPYRIISYAIERKQVAANRQLVLLAPIKVFDGFAAFLAGLLLIGKKLSRFNPIQWGKDGTPFVRFSIHKSSGTFITTGRPGSTLCATIPSRNDAAIEGVSRLGTTKLMLPTTASWLPKEGRAEAVVLTEYFRQCAPCTPPVVYPVAMGVRAYQYDPRAYDQEAKPKLQAFMSPLVHGAFAPIQNAAGEQQAVKGRITDLRKEEPKPNAFRDQCIEEFAEFIVAGATLEPVCYEVVEEKQTRPAQKLSLLRAAVEGPFLKRILKCFMKSEAYPDVKDGRNISMYNDSDKLSMAQFALALSEHCKRFPWYGPGKTPLEIAERTAEVCQGAKKFVNVSDLHRMDGTITYVLRGSDRVVMMKAFIHHRAVLNELLKRNCDNVGILPNGTTFKQGPSHGSGCSATSVLQTIRASLAAYIGFRHSFTEDGRRLSPQEAFDSIGIHLGDDGLDADLEPADHTWACNKLGLVLEAAVVQRGFRGVNFLARFYSPEVWTGCLDSMCDIKRQLSKFHTTVRLPESVTAEQKLVEKCMSYVATDGNTPVVGELCKRVLMLSTIAPSTSLGVGSWWSKFDASVQYPNKNVGGWMDVELGVSFAEFDRSRFDSWLASATAIEAILAAPLCAEPRPATPAAVDVVVDGSTLPARVEVERVEEHKQQPAEEPAAEKSAQGRPKAQKGRKTTPRKNKTGGSNKSTRKPRKQER